MDRLTSEKHNCFRETPQNNFHDHTIFPPDNEFFPVFQFESLGNQVPSIGEETHLGGRNPFSFPETHHLWWWTRKGSTDPARNAPRGREWTLTF